MVEHQGQDLNEVQGERSHQDIRAVEGKFNA